MKKQLSLIFFLCTFLFASDPQQSFWETYTAALRGDKLAQFHVGVIYERGIGIDANQSQAAYWFEKSALQGYVDAQYNIAIMYASGRGVEADEGAAMKWLALAAKQKDKESRKLLLKIIDGELDEKKPSENQKMDNSELTGELIAISPVTLVTKAGAVVCDEKNHCEPYKANSAVTSTHKRGQFYKISGTASKKGWQAYEKEGWINENSVEIRR
jgi:TPR repeat protein